VGKSQGAAQLENNFNPPDEKKEVFCPYRIIQEKMKGGGRHDTFKERGQELVDPSAKVNKFRYVSRSMQGRGDRCRERGNEWVHFINNIAQGKAKVHKDVGFHEE